MLIPVLALALVLQPVLSEQPVKRWPSPVATGFRLERLFDLSNGEYQAGHRGIDITAAPGAHVNAPVAGTVHFAGTVIDRGVLTLAVDERTLVSFEPVSASVTKGEAVRAGDLLGTVSGASHCGISCLHIGVRVNDAYVNPLRFFAASRPRLLPLAETRANAPPRTAAARAPD